MMSLTLTLLTVGITTMQTNEIQTAEAMEKCYLKDVTVTCLSDNTKKDCENFEGKGECEKVKLPNKPK